MHVDEQVLEPARARYGEPATLEFEGKISRRERDVVVHSTQGGRFHDVTFFVFHGDRLALIQKPHYAKGLWRPPGGGLKPGEPFEVGVEREAFEELGVRIVVTRYLVVTAAVFRFETQTIPWATHVFAATTEATVLAPIDTHEISAARWGTLDELQGPIRDRLLDRRSLLALPCRPPRRGGRRVAQRLDEPARTTLVFHATIVPCNVKHKVGSGSA